MGAEEGFLLQQSEEGKRLTMKKNGSIATLVKNWDAFIFENDLCMAVLNKKTFAIEHIDVFVDDDHIEIPEIPEMKMIFFATENLI
nr:hypothetical protein [Bacteroidota bacterium]